MKIIKQTSTQLVTHHHQVGKLIATVIYLLTSLSMISFGIATPILSCKRINGVANCTLIRKSLSGWEVKTAVTLQRVKTQTCDISRITKPSRGTCNTLVEVQTQNSKINFFFRQPYYFTPELEINDFIKNPNKNYLEIKQPLYLSSNIFLWIAIILIVWSFFLELDISTYDCSLDKEQDWVVLKCQTKEQTDIHEFFLSVIETVTIEKNSFGYRLNFILKNGKKICIAESYWGEANFQEIRKVIQEFI